MDRGTLPCCFNRPLAPVLSSFPYSAIPLSRVARASDYIPLSAGFFMNTFETIWTAHVEFGTSRSHKKLLGKKRHRESGEAAEAGSSEGVMGGRGMSKSAKRARQAEASGAVAISNRTCAVTASARPSAAEATQMANKGRFSGTLAAKLLAGGSG